MAGRGVARHCLHYLLRRRRRRGLVVVEGCDARGAERVGEGARGVEREGDRSSPRLQATSSSSLSVLVVTADEGSQLTCRPVTSGPERDCG